MATVFDERTQAVVATLPSIRACEEWIAEREKTEPDAVHAGLFTVDANEAEDAEYQNLRRAEQTPRHRAIPLKDWI